jgi:predicted permease
VALSFAMIAIAGLLAASLVNLERQPLGFEPDDRLVVRIDPPAPSGDDPRALSLLYSRLQERLRRVPGVADVGAALYSPMEGNNWSSDIAIEGRPRDPARPESSSWNRVMPRYFETVGTPVLRGRAIDDRDVTGARRVAVVSQAFVSRFFAEREPIGRHLGIGDEKHGQDFEIVGVVGDVKYTAASQPVRPMIFLPAFQSGDYADAAARSVQARSMLLRSIVVRTTAAQSTLEPAIREAIGEVDPAINVLRVLPMTTQVSANFRVERLLARLTTLYGLLALALACLGLYGVTSYAVAQRTREIGVRMALGADRAGVVRAIVGAPVAETLAGLAIGVPLALVTGRAIRTQLFGLGGQDPLVLGGAVLILLLTTAVAAAIPAMRAAKLDPVKALRQ